ncbi:lipase [Vibrio sp. Hep-1b-8]|nr:lipase [Vibrio sp. Hep-1b-8]
MAAGEWVISVETENLLATVEQYKSRNEQTPSPVESRAESELGAVHQNRKKYALVSVGDLWSTPPQDSFLTEHHSALKANARKDIKGVRASHNTTHVLEIKALRSYMPMIVDTDGFNLANSYTFALLSKLAYASKEKSIDKRSVTDSTGSLSTVIETLKLKQRPLQSGDLAVNWLLIEIPYSQALNFNYYADNDIGAQGYIIYNHDTAIIGVRGSEVALGSQGKEDEAENSLFIFKAKNGINAVFNAPVVQDFVRTNFDAAQIDPPEFGGTYMHRGFYQYAMAFLDKIERSLKKHKGKSIYVCGHSLGGAAALILSALIQDTYSPSTLRLYTYGMPRTGTRSFVERYRDIVHYRHVNNHDLVPQVPMTWANTDPTEGLELSDIFNSSVNLVKKMIMDNDDDNYLHHGSLSQLITYDEPKQVLLSPRQTQITMLDIAKMAENDSYALVDGLTDASIAEHGMEVYIPNLFAQLQALSKESLYDNYQGTINHLSNTIDDLQQRSLKAKYELAETLGKPYSLTNQAYLARLKQEISISEQLVHNHHQVRHELTATLNNPERYPLSLLLMSNQSLPEEVKKQIL